MVFSLTFHVASNLKILTMARKHNVGSKSYNVRVCKIPSLTWITILAILLYLPMASGHFSMKFTEVEV